MRRIYGLWIVLLLLLANIPLYAQETVLSKDSLSPSQVKSVLVLLEDSVKREEFASQLRAIVQVKEALQDTAAGQTSLNVLSFNVFDRFAEMRDRIIGSIKQIGKELSGLSLSYERVKQEMDVQEYQERFVSFILVLAGTVIGAVIVLVFLLYAARLLKKRSNSKLYRAFSEFLSGNAFWAAAASWGLMFTGAFSFSTSLEVFIFRITMATLAFSVVKTLIFSVLSPADASMRFIQIDDYKARYAVLWGGRVLRFALFMYLLFQTAHFLNWPAIKGVIEAVAKIGIAAMLAIVAFQKRNALDVSNLFRPVENDSPWKNSLKRAGRFLLSRLYLLIILYLGFMSLISLLGFRGTFRYFVAATLQSAILLLVLLFIMAMWRLVVKRAGSGNAALMRTFPEFHDQIQKNISVVERLGYGVFCLSALPLFFEFWGIGLFNLLRTWYPALKVVINVAIIVVMGFVLYQLASFIINQFQKRAARRMLESRTGHDMEVEKRVATLRKVLKKIAVSTILSIAFLMVLDELGINIKALLAGVGIVGLAVGFGAQSLVRDVISGLFMIVENRVRVGDVAIINGTGGLVEQVNLRTTVLRSQDGTIHVFPNGTINTLSNMTHEFSYYVFDVRVAYKEDTDNVSAVLKEIGDQIMTEPEYKDAILEPLEVLGVDKFADSAVIVKARIKTLPIKQWMVGREMNRRIKKRFDELGIEIPFPHRSIYFGEASKPMAFRMEREEGSQRPEARGQKSEARSQRPEDKNERAEARG